VKTNMKKTLLLMVSVALTSRTRTAARVAVAMAVVFCFSKLHAATNAQPLTWLKTANYSPLEGYLGGLQRDYESGMVSEYQLYEGFRDLYEDRSDNARYFDHWVQAYPNSYAARTARGAYYYRMAGFLRGDDYTSQTPPERIQGMLNYLVRARPDLRASLKMTAKPYLSTLYLLNVARLAGSPEDRRQWLDAGNAIDPNNELLRSRYMDCLTPRWGGSLEMMRDFRAESERQHVSAQLLTRFDIIIQPAPAGCASETTVAAGIAAIWRHTSSAAALLQPFQASRSPRPAWMATANSRTVRPLRKWQWRT
jgi:hypothetical protein